MHGWGTRRTCEPSASLIKRFMAVSTTVIESLSGSMKSSAWDVVVVAVEEAVGSEEEEEWRVGE